jgi:signal peptidase II
VDLPRRHGARGRDRGATLPRTSSSWQAAAYGLLLSGAVGNVIDRLVRDGGPDAPSFGGGEVVDFVAWGSFPRFNVADSAITVGFVLLVLTLWLDERRTAERRGRAR